MSAITFNKSIPIVMCLLLFALTLNCYGAMETAEEFFAQGKRFSLVENSDHAIYNYSEAIKRNPKFVRAYNNRAIAYWYKGEVARARQDIQKAQSLGISVNPEMVKKIMGAAP